MKTHMVSFSLKGARFTAFVDFPPGKPILTFAMMEAIASKQTGRMISITTGTTIGIG